MEFEYELEFNNVDLALEGKYSEGRDQNAINVEEDDFDWELYEYIANR